MDTIIDLVVASSLFSGLISIITFLGIIDSTADGILQVVMYFIFGGLSLIFGIKYLNLKTNIYGKNKMIGYLYVINGVCIVLIILSPIAFVLQIITDIVFASLFDIAASEER